ncbi:MAG: hypothetical protein IJ763_04180 [Lachnospiraceae bacterium]|nr:hypothetical protein [Lachnospiraceae bacterium]
MKKIIFFVLSFLICVVISGCNKSYGESDTTRKKFENVISTKESLYVDYEENLISYYAHGGNGTGVMMFYIVGSNLESEAGLASSDIEELQQSNFDNDRLKVVICTGGADEWWNDDIDSDEAAVYELFPGTDKLDKLTVLDNDNMADPETLTSFMDYVYENYSADYYSMVLWNHGGGAVLGYGEDERHNYDVLTMNELDEAFVNSKLISDGHKFEWIGFDACLMGMLEVADLFAPYSNYLIASEEVEAGDGWDYKCFDVLSNGENFTGDSAGKVIIDAYADYYDSYVWYKPEYSLSCLDLSKTDEVMNDFETFISVVEGDLLEGKYSTIARQRGRTKAFGIVNGSLCYDTVDLYNLTENMHSSYADEADALQSSLSEMIVYERTNINNANGIAIYFPYNNKLYAGDWVDEYRLNDFSDEYMQFVVNFTETFNGEPLTAWDDITNEDASVMIASDTGGSGNDIGDLGSMGSFSVHLSDEQAANYSGASISIWELNDRDEEYLAEGSYLLWISSKNVTLSDDGTLTASLANKHFVLGDTSGNQVDCCAANIEIGDGYAIYIIPIMATYKNSDGWLTSESYYIYVMVDDENPTGKIIGIYEDYDVNVNSLPQKKNIVLEQDAIISTFCFGRVIKYNDDGSMAPLNDWEHNSGWFDTFHLDGELTIDMVDINPDTEKVYIFDISDTQGNDYILNVVQ